MRHIQIWYSHDGRRLCATCGTPLQGNLTLECETCWTQRMIQRISAETAAQCVQEAAWQALKARVDSGALSDWSPRDTPIFFEPFTHAERMTLAKWTTWIGWKVRVRELCHALQVDWGTPFM